MTPRVRGHFVFGRLENQSRATLEEAQSCEVTPMKAVLNNEGQITIPKSILVQTGLEPGAELTVAVNESGDLILRKEVRPAELRPDRWDRALGSAEIKWNGTTDEYMAFIR